MFGGRTAPASRGAVPAHLREPSARGDLARTRAIKRAPLPSTPPSRPQRAGGPQRLAGASTVSPARARSARLKTVFLRRLQTSSWQGSTFSASTGWIHWYPFCEHLPQHGGPSHLPQEPAAQRTASHRRGTSGAPGAWPASRRRGRRSAARPPRRSACAAGSRRGPRFFNRTHQRGTDCHPLPDDVFLLRAAPRVHDGSDRPGICTARASCARGRRRFFTGCACDVCPRARARRRAVTWRTQHPKHLGGGGPSASRAPMKARVLQGTEGSGTRNC